MSDTSLYYPPDIAMKAVVELTIALEKGYKEQDADAEEYANALLADPRMTNTKGLLASCGASYKNIKLIRSCVSGHLPTLVAQKEAIAFLDNLDHEAEVMNG